MQIRTQSADASAGSRQAYWDGVKGIAIFAVIVIHVVPSREVLTLAQVDQWMMILTRQFVNFAVPTFLALSGMMAAMTSRPKDAKYVRLRLAKLWPAYLFWSVVFIVLFHRPDLRNPGAMAVDILAGQGIGIGYFVIVLSQMIILTPLLARIRSVAGHLGIIVGLTLAGKIYTYGTTLGFMSLGSFPKLSNFPYSVLPFIVWYPFYHLGYMIANRIDISRPRYGALAIALFAMIVFLLISIAECTAWLRINPQLAAAQFKASSSAYSIALFFVAFLLSPILSRRVPQFLVFAGRNSYIIYLAHIIPLKLITKLASWVGLATGTIQQVAIVASGTFVVCLVMAAVGRRWLPDRLQPYILG
ncbi:hypothetical protein IP65_19785 [Novosphingobium sp. AAP1]|uniref:acyltransferase n=1 Tax=Novosphingobium sp. AAP1 TaxID=1523413 RepID=UPI0006B91C01|nr:acyltransferase [Novosphingobium sp. AAP1]KPF50454.1 hypothetical protein IP65_19785 [Novosphingobium sp. AAP1]